MHCYPHWQCYSAIRGRSEYWTWSSRFKSQMTKKVSLQQRTLPSSSQSPDEPVLPSCSGQVLITQHSSLSTKPVLAFFLCILQPWVPTMTPRTKNSFSVWLLFGSIFLLSSAFLRHKVWRTLEPLLHFLLIFSSLWASKNICLWPWSKHRWSIK